MAWRCCQPGRPTSESRRRTRRHRWMRRSTPSMPALAQSDTIGRGSGRYIRGRAPPERAPETYRCSRRRRHRSVARRRALAWSGSRNAAACPRCLTSEHPPSRAAPPPPWPRATRPLPSSAARSRPCRTNPHCCTRDDEARRRRRPRPVRRVRGVAGCPARRGFAEATIRAGTPTVAQPGWRPVDSQML